jgi:type I restriction enzyme S subunit
MQYQGETNGEFLFCKVSDMNLPGNEIEIHTTVHSIEADVMKKIRARANPVGTVIFPKIGGAIATHKRRLVIKPTIIDNNCSGIQPIGLTDNRWLLLFMRSLDLTKYQSGTSVPAVSQGSIDPIRIGLPPLAEQKRIVEKVDELMALCDRLALQQQERGTRHAALARASLARFADAPTPANLPFLFHPSYAIPPADLRKSILTLAVQGKLVPQDPNDEPAENCLLRLGLTDKATSLNQVDVSDEELPLAWAKVRFEDVAIVSGGVTLGRKLGERKTVTLPYLRVANVKRGEIDLAVIKDVSIGEDEIERYALRENDLLMTEGGDWDKVGRAAIWRAEIPICLHQNHVFRARMRSVEIKPFWFERYFNSPIGRSYFESASKQTTNLASINMRQVRNCPIPFPPLAEQRRIVAKVEQLMTMVDALETQLAASRATAANLLAAIVAELTGPPHNGKISLPATSRGRGRPPQS